MNLDHVYHNEELLIIAGRDGLLHAIRNLSNVADAILGFSSISISHKIDGSPAIVVGVHPLNGKFFVATKSAFNADPKINYTPDDVLRNHGHNEGLTSKLLAALQTLPNVISNGVYQGDLLFTPEDVLVSGEKVAFTPNTIRYEYGLDHRNASLILGSKIGISLHTEYAGLPATDKCLFGMRATPKLVSEYVQRHQDVFMMCPGINPMEANYDSAAISEIRKIIKHIQYVDETSGSNEYETVAKYATQLRRFFNARLKKKAGSGFIGFVNHASNAMYAEAQKLKTESYKEKKIAAMNSFIDDVEQNSYEIKIAIQLHDLLAEAKNILVEILATTVDVGTYVGDVRTKPEGFVLNSHNGVVKLVDREEFSRLNFENRMKK